MPRRVYIFEDPDRFIAAAVGQPGSRVFYLQAREGTRVVTVRLEKVQVALREPSAHAQGGDRPAGGNGKALSKC